MKLLYRDYNIEVYTNGAGEIFISCSRNKDITVRITPTSVEQIITCHNARLIPWQVNGMSAILVK